MKVIFLDIDGVLNSERFFSNRITGAECVCYNPMEHIDSKAVELLSEIVDATGAKVVISSTWRHGHSPREMKDILGHFGFKGHIIGMTPVSGSYECRGEEIDAWLTGSGMDRKDPVERFVILDDDADMTPHMNWLVQTSWRNGLQKSHVRRAINLLGRKDR